MIVHLTNARLPSQPSSSWKLNMIKDTKSRSATLSNSCQLLTVNMSTCYTCTQQVKKEGTKTSAKGHLVKCSNDHRVIGHSSLLHQQPCYLTNHIEYRNYENDKNDNDDEDGNDGNEGDLKERGQATSIVANTRRSRYSVPVGSNYSHLVKNII